ncbi:nitric oxide-associated protein 1 [Nilaparvata lugens]|uniref:nitric oxide-associated protein 1 n=1 Tax=Nilaparvata lugens TaxID=108931 RepID=UPI00193CA790|nr:nitric oxide-associated protein 1 [Nilaparvata lugens]
MFSSKTSYLSCYFYRNHRYFESVYLRRIPLNNSLNVRRNHSVQYEIETNPNIKNKEDFYKMKNEFRDRVIFHSFYKYEGFQVTKMKEETDRKIRYRIMRNRRIVPASLKYLMEKKDLHLLGAEDSVKENDLSVESVDKVVLPYEVVKVQKAITKEEELDATNDIFVDEEIQRKDAYELNLDNMRARSGKWMQDYENFEDDEEVELDFSKYGTPSLAIPMSKTPCGGCGALLHCQDPGIPGYIPSEIFINCEPTDLLAIKCQRCHFMENYKMALTVSVNPEEYPRLLSRIKNQKALVILMVDMTDFPCSIWPGILDVIGPKQPLFVVGNKVDLLVGDYEKWVRRASQSLKAALPPDANVKHMTLISAKTGFGVEELITELHLQWEYQGDVYLVGCTNVGKSTLFNALIQSDYCKVRASDVMQRATTSPWPGTTLNLLRFPILRPSAHRLQLRAERLKQARMIASADARLAALRAQGLPAKRPQSLQGRIGRSFTDVYRLQPDLADPFAANRRTNRKESKFGLNPNDPAYRDSRWFYDTPGVVQPDQIIDLLTTEELVKVLPRTPIHHRVYIVREGETVFIAGLARLDFVQGDCESMRMVIFKTDSLPVTICKTEHADAIYNDYLGTAMLAVPCGGPDRLAVWPRLQPADEIVLKGVSERECCADIVLSNAGWISMAQPEGKICKFRAWTPDRRGIHVRTVPLLRYAIEIRGTRVSRAPVYNRAVLKESMDG